MINWKVYSSPMVLPPNDGVALFTDDKGEDKELHTNNRKVILTRNDKPVECHIYKKNYVNKFPERYNNESYYNRKYQPVPALQAQEQVLVNLTIGGQWWDEADYSDILFYKTAIKYTPSPTRGSYKSSLTKHGVNADYYHNLSHIIGRIIPLWILLYN